MTLRAIDIQDRQRAFQDLLDNVAVTAEQDPNAFRRIKRVRKLAHEWFSTRAGWAVVVERDFARLLKTPARHRPSGEFAKIQGPRDYEMMMWVLWYGEKLGFGQFLLTQLAEEIAAHANLVVGSGHIDWRERAQRYALLRAVDVLIDVGALVRYDGEIERWASQREGDVLYELTDLALRIYTALPDHVFDALVEEQDASVLEAEPPSDVSDEERLYRTLLLQPALYRFDDPSAFALLVSRDRRRRVAADLVEHLGWELELTPNYVAVVRLSAARLRRTFPRRGTTNHVALLMAGRIRQLLKRGRLQPSEDDRVALSRAQLESELLTVRKKYGDNWSLAFRDRPFTEQFADMLSSMREWGLLEGPDAHDRFSVLPLAGRFQAIYTKREDALAGRDDGE